jgi:hypothetical protein
VTNRVKVIPAKEDDTCKDDISAGTLDRNMMAHTLFLFCCYIEKKGVTLILFLRILF